MAMKIINDPTNPRGFAQAVVAIVFLCLSWPAVLARLAARIHIKSLGRDDLLTVIAQICYTVFLVAAIAFHDAVPGKDAVSWDRAELAIKWLIVNETTFAASMLFLKLALGAFFLRIVVSKSQRMVIYVAMCISTIVNLYVLIMAIFACGNPKFFLIRYITHQCVPKSVLQFTGFTQAATNTLTDLTFAGIPFFLLKGSRLPKHVKLYVGGILVLATTGCVASIVRFWYTNNLFSVINFYPSVGALFIVGIVEIGTGIIASSLTTIRPLIKSIAGYKTTVRSYMQNRTKSSRKSVMVDLEGNRSVANEDVNELQEVIYYNNHLKRTTASSTSEEVLWSPVTLKEEAKTHVVESESHSRSTSPT